MKTLRGTKSVSDTPIKQRGGVFKLKFLAKKLNPNLIFIKAPHVDLTPFKANTHLNVYQFKQEENIEKLDKIRKAKLMQMNIKEKERIDRIKHLELVANEKDKNLSKTFV